MDDKDVLMNRKVEISWMATNLDAFLIIDPADHPHTHLSNLTESWLLQTNVSEDLDHSFPHADTSVLYTKYNSNH